MRRPSPGDLGKPAPQRGRPIGPPGRLEGHLREHPQRGEQPRPVPRASGTEPCRRRSSSASAKAVSLITRIDAPDTGTTPVSPSGLMVVLGGMLGGLLTGFGVVLLTAPAAAPHSISSAALAGQAAPGMGLTPYVQPISLRADFPGGVRGALEHDGHRARQLELRPSAADLERAGQVRHAVVISDLLISGDRLFVGSLAGSLYGRGGLVTGRRKGRGTGIGK